MTVEELWKLIAFDTNEVVNLNPEGVKIVKNLLEKHRGVFVSLGRKVGQALSQFEFETRNQTG